MESRMRQYLQRRYSLNNGQLCQTAEMVFVGVQLDDFPHPRLLTGA